MKRATVNVSSSATLLHTPAGTGLEHHLLINTGPNVVFYGGSGVTTSTGIAAGPGSRIELHGVTSALYAITGSGTSQVSVAVNVQ